MAMTEIDNLKAQLESLIGKFNLVIEEQESSETISSGIDQVVLAAQQAVIKAQEGVENVDNALAQIDEVIENRTGRHSALSLADWLQSLEVPDGVIADG